MRNKVYCFTPKEGGYRVWYTRTYYNDRPTPKYNRSYRGKSFSNMLIETAVRGLIRGLFSR